MEIAAFFNRRFFSRQRLSGFIAKSQRRKVFAVSFAVSRLCDDV
jgi:hypothetical protein